MILKSLEIQGFKTFPDKTKLEFDKGITAVVGPNGSGKSNISDSIRWVLGEQSAKALRCSKMEDVVFNGTDKRKKVGYAEVTLTIDNKDRTLSFDGDTVAVTRRYYRSGESEYLINKASVRLKDIHELFMDTGLGRDGYSMISQGKIDSIVASKSEDRREVFEEASGISRYRYRKLEAERKLAQTEENLLRLRDILSELEQRVGPLEKQAEKAKAYLEYAKEKEGLEIALWLNTIERSGSLLREQEDKITVAKLQHEEAVKALEEISKETEEIYDETGGYASKMDEIRRINSEIENEISDLRSKISVEENNISHTLEAMKRIETEMAQLDEANENLGKELEEKTKRLDEIKGEHERETKIFNQKTRELSDIMRDDGMNAKLTACSSVLSELNIKLANERAALKSANESVLELDARMTSADESLTVRGEQLARYKKELAQCEESRRQARQRITSFSAAAVACSADAAQAAAARDALKANADRLTLDRREAQRHKKFLEDLENNLEGFNKSVKLVVKEAKNGRLGGIHGPVSRVIRVPSEFAVAVETALGGAMQNIVTSTEDDAKKAIAFLKRTDGGRATFLPMATIRGRELEERGIEANEGFVGIASRLCQCDEQYSGILRSLLGRICIAKDLDCAAKIAAKGGYRFKVVTLDGQVVNAGGSLTGGSYAKNSGLLSRVSDIEKFTKQTIMLDEQIDANNKELSNAQARLNELQLLLDENNRQLAQANEDSFRADTACKAAADQIKLLTDTISEQSADK